MSRRRVALRGSVCVRLPPVLRCSGIQAICTGCVFSGCRWARSCEWGVLVQSPFGACVGRGAGGWLRCAQVTLTGALGRVAGTVPRLDLGMSG